MSALNQDQWIPSEEEAWVLAKNNVSTWLAGKLMEAGAIEFRYIDPDVYPRPGKPLWDGLHLGFRHADGKLFDWFERELAKPALAPVAAPPPPPVVREARKPSVGRVLDGPTKGQLAYEARTSGEGWPAIAERLGLGSPVNAAKKWALANGAAWPIK